MKTKSIFLALIALMLCCQASAQISLHAGDATVTNASGTLIRSWDYNHIVSWYKINMPRLDITDIYNNVIYRTPMPTFTVLDMAILGDYLYFCGRSSMDDNSYGVLGRIYLRDIISSLTSVSIWYVFLSNVNTINKLTVYYDGNTPHVAAIGETFVTLDYTYSTYSFIDCLYNGTSPTMLTINTRSFSLLERYDDLMETNNHIVCVGYYSNMMGPSFCYRRALKSNLSDAIFDTIHYYNGGNEALSTTRSTAMNNDMIAVSYLAQNSIGGNVTRTRLLNTANGANTKTFEYNVPSETAHNGIVFVPKANNIIVMQNYYLMGGLNTNFMYIDPTATATYVSTVEYKQREFFRPIAVHDNIFYLAANGAKWIYKDATTPPSGYPNTGCPHATDKELRIIGALTHLKKRVALSLISDTNYVFSMPAPVSSQTMIIECTNQ